MRLTTGLAVAVLMLAASCSTPDPFARTDIGKKRIELMRSGDVSDAILHPERKRPSSEEFLGNAAFEITRGMDADRAVRTFEADGASCAERTCVWEYTVREALFPCGLPPVSFVSMCIRPPGPRRTFHKRYEVTLPDRRIEDRADISARSSVRTLKTGE